MKKVKYVLIMMIGLLSVVSCSDDDDMGNSIVGTWEFQEFEEEFDYEYNLTITFNENLTGQLSVTEIEDGETYTDNESFTWSTSGNQLTLDISGDIEIETYSISGNKLTIGVDSDSIVLTRQ